jgi:flagellar basal-body rod protein FlgB
MTAINITGSQVGLLSNLLDGAALRHRVIANNIANINTPGFRQLSVSFEDALAQALDRGNMDKALQMQPQIVFGVGGATRLDGNNVDIDLEMGDLAKNTLFFRTVNQVLANQLGILRSAITGQ